MMSFCLGILGVIVCIVLFCIVLKQAFKSPLESNDLIASILFFSFMFIWIGFYGGISLFVLSTKPDEFPLVFTIMNIVFPLIFINHYKQIYTTIVFNFRYENRYREHFSYKEKKAKELSFVQNKKVYDEIEKDERESIQLLKLVNIVGYIIMLVIIMGVYLDIFQIIFPFIMLFYVRMIIFISILCLIILICTNKKYKEVKQNDVLTPTNARKDFYNLIKQVNDDHKPVVINGNKSDNSAVIISKDDWDSIQEMLYLESTGVMNKVREREQDDSGFTNVDDIDWDNSDD